MSIVFMKILDN